MKKCFLVIFSLSLFILSACNNTSSENDDASVENAQNEVDQEEKGVADNTDSSEEKKEPKTFDINSVIDNTGIETKGNWIQKDGSLAPLSDFVISEPIDYNFEDTYKIHLSGYVSYFEDEEFIKTVRYSKEVPDEIESVSNANNIKVSYRPADFE